MPMFSETALRLNNFCWRRWIACRPFLSHQVHLSLAQNCLWNNGSKVCRSNGSLASRASPSGSDQFKQTELKSDSQCSATFKGLDELVKGVGGGDSCLKVLRKLGIEKESDLKYVMDEDMVKQGVSLVVARKLLSRVHTSELSSTEKAKDGLAAPAPISCGCFNPEQTMESLAKKGVSSGERSTSQVLCSSFLGGSYLAWGCAFTTVVAGGSSIFLADAPGLLSLLTGAVFPVGVVMVLLNNSELLTGNFMTLALPAWTHPHMKISEVIARKIRICWISFWGNFAGSLLVAYGFYSLSVVQVGSPASDWIAALAAKKCALSMPVAIGKGIGANWLVNVATVQAASAHTGPGKIASLWVPVMTVVAMNLELAPANMFFLPLGYLCGADVTMLDIALNIGPVALGNALGAIVFVSGLQRYAVLRNLVFSKTRSN
eukprot:TRINITY_DN49440_c0_g1_i1.p1 TRINITY_DN49440_c0_g1~~TRINITY_DN49440_c0_g1_i1.p1  ORF type:complete len:432 (-),score=74.69 TRINITY_DN49440_c0_g1_i1:181-1476(-)